MPAPPEQGQLVQVRQRFWLVDGVVAGLADGARPPLHRITLECLDDDQLGQRLDVLWEHEIHKQVHDAVGLPRPDAWDSADRFDAFLDATRWTLSSVLEGLPLQAPFRGNIRIEDYQLEPVVRALQMPRVSLLIADDVGLGKTIEAGLVLQEMMARQRVRRVLVLCPASLCRQWQDEMNDRFALPFEIMDRAYVQKLRREYGVHVNPWDSYPRLICSYDFLKREGPWNAFRAALKHTKTGALKDWDLLILDEAHNVAPTGRSSWVVDSDRTMMVRQLKDCFEHRLFLTATPHNGFTESFTALLEMLDPIRFSRGPTLDRSQLDAVMVRRLKESIVDALGRRIFPKRLVLPLELNLGTDEQALFDTLNQYIDARLSRSDKRDKLPVQFALVMLKRRLLSSPFAFVKSLRVHHTHLRDPDAPTERRPEVVQNLQASLAEESDDDQERDDTEETALIETARWFQVTDAEMRLVEDLRKRAEDAAEKPDAKLTSLLAFIRATLAPDSGWNQQRLLVFTEFKDTLEFLRQQMERLGWSDRVLALYGGMGSEHREEVKAAFQTSPADANGQVRILLATDAAAEGLNLQAHCHQLVHYDIPWNPNRMEQRNGRIDRHGQRAPEVFCRHFVFQGREDLKFLATVVEKVETMRQDLGAVGEIIAAQVEEAMLGRRRHLDLPKPNMQRARDEVKSEVMHQDRVRELHRRWQDARRDLGLYPERLRRVIEEALAIAGHGRLSAVDDPSLQGRAWLVRQLPPTWVDAAKALRHSKGGALKAVFDEADTRTTDGGRREDTSLVHLDHPLMKRALGVFRANLWAAGLHDSHRLNRVSYKVVDDIDYPVVVAVGRVVCVSAHGLRLHEELFAVAGEISAENLSQIDDIRAQAFLQLKGEHPLIPAAVGDRLRLLFPRHERLLQNWLETAGKLRSELARKALGDKGKQDAKTVRELIDLRTKEITKTIAEMQKERDAGAQLALWPQEQRDQHDVTLNHLRLRLEQLVVERETEPAAVRARYELRPPRTFPLALLYILPRKLVGGAS